MFSHHKYIQQETIISHEYFCVQFRISNKHKFYIFKTLNMCLRESLQQKSYNVAIFHISLSFIQLLFLAHFVFQKNFITKTILCKNENLSDNDQAFLFKENDGKALTDEIDELEDGCYIGVITSLSIALILIIDLSINFLLCHSVRERKNILFIPWLISQVVRILFCVVAICLVINLYVFDNSEKTKNIYEKDSENIYTILSDNDSM